MSPQGQLLQDVLIHHVNGVAEAAEKYAAIMDKPASQRSIFGPIVAQGILQMRIEQASKLLTHITESL